MQLYPLPPLEAIGRTVKLRKQSNTSSPPKFLSKNSKQEKGCPSNSDRMHLKILTPRQVLQSLPIALAQVKASNISDNVLIKSKKL